MDFRTIAKSCHNYFIVLLLFGVECGVAKQDLGKVNLGYRVPGALGKLVVFHGQNLRTKWGITSSFRKILCKAGQRGEGAGHT